MKNNKLGLYVHIPFCENKCPYCDFYSITDLTNNKTEYTKAVCDELVNLNRLKEFVANDCKEKIIDSIYFGGGTPSYFGASCISEIIKTIKQEFNVSKNVEICVECNPSSSNKEFFEILAKTETSRVSLGLQSANNVERKNLGRKASAENAKNSVIYAREAGIDNISLDLMLGIPNSNLDSLKNSIDFCLDLEISHISAYMLKIEEGTEFAKHINKLNLPDEDEVCEMYEFLCDYLNKNDLFQYEISNFAKKSFESRHNLKYWNCDEYLGIGPSAHSFYNNKRFYFDRDIKGFIKGNAAKFDTNGGSFEEYAMLRLRLTDGLNEDHLKLRYNFGIPHYVRENAKIFEENGFLISDEKGIRLNIKGFLISNTIISGLLKL